MNGSALALLAQFLLGIAAFGCLSLAMERHARQAGRQFRAGQRTALRAAGWLLIGVMVITAIATTGLSQGLVAVLGALSLSALLVVGVLSYCPQWLVRVSLAGILGGLSMMVLWL